MRTRLPPRSGRIPPRPERGATAPLPPGLAAELPELPAEVLRAGFTMALEGRPLRALRSELGLTRYEALTFLVHAGRRDGGRNLPPPELLHLW